MAPLNTLRSGGDWTPQSISDNMSGYLQEGAP